MLHLFISDANGIFLLLGTCFSSHRSILSRPCFVSLRLFLLIISTFCKPYKSSFLVVFTVPLLPLTSWYEGHFMSSEALASIHINFSLLYLTWLPVVYQCLCYIQIVKKRMQTVWTVHGLLSSALHYQPPEQEMTSSYQTDWQTLCVY